MKGVIHIPGLIGDISLVIDPLSAFFILVISVMSMLGIVYSLGYIKPYLGKNRGIFSHYLFLTLLIISMLLVTVVQNALAFLIVWEIMSLSSFFLVIFEGEKKEVQSAGINYLITMHISVLFLIAGFILLSSLSGSYDFATFKTALNSNPSMSNLAFVLLFVGFGIKAGFVPFHTWLPKAHPAAPSHISGLMSGVMIKTGIYGILRALTWVQHPSLGISYFVLGISVVSALFGVLYAIAQHDLKKLLAYHSIENIGIIGIGIGIGMLGLAYNNNLVAILGFSGGILHIMNHAIFKQLLFFGAGAVYNKTHTRDIEKLGGLVKSMPATAVLFLIGSVAITGLPPLNGFISEFLIYLAFLNGLSVNSSSILIISVISVAALALVGTMALLCFTKAFGIVFLGAPRSDKAAHVIKDASRLMLVPMSVLATFALIIGLFPQFVINLVMSPVSVIMNSETSLPVEYTNILKTVSLCGFWLITLFGAIYGSRILLLRGKSVSQHKTWGCGYPNVNSRMQYTASSYGGLFLSFFKPFFSSHFGDVVEFYLINPMLKLNKKFVEAFYWIQSGNTQQYIMYGLVFLILAIIYTAGMR